MSQRQPPSSVAGDIPPTGPGKFAMVFLRPGRVLPTDGATLMANSLFQCSQVLKV